MMQTQTANHSATHSTRSGALAPAALSGPEPGSHLPADKRRQARARMATKITFRDHRAGPGNLNQSPVQQLVFRRQPIRQLEPMQTGAGPVNAIRGAKVSCAPVRDKWIVVGIR